MNKHVRKHHITEAKDYKQLKESFPDREVRIEISVKADGTRIICWAYSPDPRGLAYHGTGSSFKIALADIIEDREKLRSEGY